MLNLSFDGLLYFQLFSFTNISEVSSKLSCFLTYLTAIGSVMTTQQENMDFCSKLKSIE